MRLGHRGQHLTVTESAYVRCECTRRLLSSTVGLALIFIFFQYNVCETLFRVIDQAQPYNRYDEFYEPLAIRLLARAGSSESGSWKLRGRCLISTRCWVSFLFVEIAGRRMPDVSNSLSATATTLLHLIISSEWAEAGISPFIISFPARDLFAL